MISDIAYIHGSKINGNFRIHRPDFRVARNGNEYLSLQLEDISGAIDAQMWRSRYQGDKYYLAEMDKMTITGKLRCFDNRWIVDIETADPLDSCINDAVALLPNRLCVRVDKVQELQALIATLQLPALRQFLNQIFADDNMLIPFTHLPASVRHHHAYAGGLLEHSLQCATMVKAMPGFDPIDHELGIVAALLHDIAKVVTMADNSTAKKRRILLKHDSITLEVIAPFLSYLDSLWADGALALRYILTWGNNKTGRNIPAITMAELVTSVDRISAGIDREQVAFNGAPSWQSMVNDNGVKRWRTSAEEVDQLAEIAML